MSRQERLLALAVGAAALASGWPALTSGYEGPYDEGNTLCAAWRVLGGEAAYRDFWLLHPPGTAWLLAAAFRVFGTTLAVERAVKLAVVALAAVLIFLLARLTTRAGWAAAAALLFVLLPTQTLSLRSRDTGLVLVLATLLAACTPSDRPRRRAFVAGLLAGGTAWFKHDFVAAAAVAGAVAACASVAGGAPAARKLRAARRDALVPFAVGLAAGLAALAVALAAQGTFREFSEQAILFPATSFGRFRSIPLFLRFDQLSGAVGQGISLKRAFDLALVPAFFLAALAAAVGGVVWGGRLLRAGVGDGMRFSSALLASSVACLFLLAPPYQRADLEHLNPAMALALVTLAGLPLAAPGLAAVAVVALAAPAGARRAGFPPDLVDTARFVESASRPGERIYVGNARHDRLAYGAPLVYFLAGRRGATRYDNLHPGVATTRPVQEEIVRSLESAGTRWIVLWDGPPPAEPNESSVSTGVVVLDEWIAGRGREAARFGSFRVLRVSAAPMPRG